MPQPGPYACPRPTTQLRCLPVKYEKVPHSHIVPAGYLRSWTTDGRIAMRLVDRAASKVIGVRDAAVRTDFYKRMRPTTGDVMYDTEWSLGTLENVALPVVTQLSELWPLTDDDKAKAAEFFAAQYVRGPAFKAWHERFLSDVSRTDIEKLRADPERYASPRPGMTHAEAVEQSIEHLFGDTWRHRRMLSLVRSLATLIGSMHWTLVQFEQHRVVTSDHPIVSWSFRRGERSRPAANDLDEGVGETLEIFVPIGPGHVLLMTWLDAVDRSDIVGGLGRHIATANAFVVANADRQWFHRPGDSPWRPVKGPRKPLSADLVPRYDVHTAARSSRRREAVKYAGAEAGGDPTNDPITIVSVSGPG